MSGGNPFTTNLARLNADGTPDTSFKAHIAGYYSATLLDRLAALSGPVAFGCHGRKDKGKGSGLNPFLSFSGEA